MIINVEVDLEEYKEECKLFLNGGIKRELQKYVDELQKECYIYVGGCDRTPKTILRDLEDILKGA